MRIPLQVAVGILNPIPPRTLVQLSALTVAVSWESHRECRRLENRHDFGRRRPSWSGALPEGRS